MFLFFGIFDLVFLVNISNNDVLKLDVDFVVKISFLIIFKEVFFIICCFILVVVEEYGFLEFFW